jgi:hypothetical protein
MYYPREGFILWTAGMLLVLLANNFGEWMSRKQELVNIS